MYALSLEEVNMVDGGGELTFKNGTWSLEAEGTNKDWKAVAKIGGTWEWVSTTPAPSTPPPTTSPAPAGTGTGGAYVGGNAPGSPGYTGGGHPGAGGIGA